MKTRKEHNKEEILGILDTYSSTTIELLNKTVGHQNASSDLIKTLMTETDEQTIRELAHLHTLCEISVGPFAENHYEFTGIIRGLKRYGHFNDKALDTLTGEDLRMAAALINTTAAIYTSIKNPPLNITTPHDPNTAEIYLNETAANLVMEHRDLLGELIYLHYQYDGDEASIINLIAGLPYLDSYTQADLNHVTKTTIQNVFNILNVTAALSEHTDQQDTIVGEGHEDDRPVHLNNPELETYITSNPEHATDLITYIQERATSNLQGFQQYLTDQTVLREGVL